MALIDLSRLNTDINTNNPVPRVFSEENASGFNEMAKFGQQLTDTAMTLFAKKQEVETDREALTAMTAYREDVNKAHDFASKNKDIRTGFIADTQLTYDQYMSQVIEDRRKFYEDGMKEEMSKAKFNPQANTFGSDEKIKSIFEATKIASEGAKELTNEQISLSSDRIRYADPLTLTKTLDEELGKLGDHFKVIEKSAGSYTAKELEVKAKRELTLAAIKNSLLTMHTDTRGSTDFNELLGSVLLPKEFVDSKGSIKKYVKGSVEDVTINAIPEKDREEYLKQFGMIDEQGNYTELAFNLANNASISAYENSKYVTASEKQAFFAEALSIVLDRKKNSENNGKDLEILLNNIINIPLDLGKWKKTTVGFDRMKGALGEVLALRSDERFHGERTPLQWLDKMYEADANYVEFLRQSSPTLALQKGNEFNRQTSLMRIQNAIMESKDYALKSAFNEWSKYLGTSRRAKERTADEAKSRSIKLAMANNPEEARIVFGSESLERAAQAAYTDKGINEKALINLERKFQGEFRLAIAPWNKDAPQTAIAQLATKFYTSNKNILESNDPRAISLAFDPFIKLSPEVGAKMLTTLESKGYMKPDDVASLRTRLVFRGNSNQSLVRDVVSTSQGAGLKELNILAKKEPEQFKKINDKVTELVNDFYGYSADSTTKAVAINHMRNYVFNKWANNSSLDVEEYATSLSKQLLHDDKINFNSTNVKGTVKRVNSQEDADDIQSRLETKLNTFKSNAIKGTIDIDLSSIPGYSNKLGKVGEKDKSKLNQAVMKDMALNINYDTVLESADDSGNDRKMYVTIRDKNTNQKYYLRNSKGQLHTIEVD